MTWEVGDLAVCVDAEPHPDDPNGKVLAEGKIYTVSGVDTREAINSQIGLYLAEVVIPEVESDWFIWTGSFNSARFRKIKPDAHEDCEPEFVELLRRSRVPACGPDYRQRMMLEALFGRMASPPRFRASHGAPADRHPSGFNRLSQGEE